jgi:N-methylhydantoinase A/oxoprolinase/acetone carboxylase beta subunit
VTDAHIALGRLEAAQLSGGVTLDADAARASIAALAKTLGATPERTAQAAVAIADAAMARALRRVSVERGVDPRSCALVAFGGGGPLHACALAELLGMNTVLVPPHAGVLSALGLAIAPERHEAAASVMRATTAVTAEWLGDLLDMLARRAVGAEGPREGAGPVRYAWHARVRYAGQGHELDIACAPGDDGAAVAGRFGAAHARRYGFTLERVVEIVAVRVAAMGEPVPVEFRAAGTGARAVRGPHVITLPDATMVVADGWTARPLPIGGWLMERA